MKLLLVFLLSAYYVSGFNVPRDTANLEAAKTDDVEASSCTVGCSEGTDTACGYMSGCVAQCCLVTCLHGNNIVHTRRGNKHVKQLSTSDEVMVVDDEGVVGFEPMYMDVHRNENIRNVKFVKIVTNRKRKLVITPGHLIYLGHSVYDSKLVPGESVRVGDPLLVYDEKKQYLQVEHVANITDMEDVGIYNPLVKSGRMMVDGILTSNYPDMKPIPTNLFHSFFWTIRQAYCFDPSLVKSINENNYEYISSFVENVIVLYGMFGNY